MALVHDDEVEEVRRILFVKTRTTLVPRDGLIDGEVHLPALVDLAVLDLLAGIAKGGEILVLGVVHQDVAIGQVEDPGMPMLSGPVPARIPELPADLEGDHRFPRPGGHLSPFNNGVRRDIRPAEPT